MKTKQRSGFTGLTREREPLIQQKNVLVIGLGYVGLPLALLARQRGYSVAGIDISPRRRSMIMGASVPDLDESFAESLKAEQFVPSADFSPVATADIIVICVPTPVDEDRNPDLTPVTSACEGIAEHLRKGQLVILESTVHPGTCEEIMIPILESKSKLKAGKDFGVAHCPERINPGDRYWPVRRIPRVIGATTPQALEEASAFYRSILDALVYEMKNIREAEAVKVVENSFRDINIAFVNELAMSFTKLNIDVVNVLEGAATKPFGFMLHYPGAGVGGHCIPVDPYYLIRYAKKNGFSHRFLSLAREINEHMPEFTVEILERSLAEAGKEINGAEVALLGISYKANISDLRESPSFEIEHILKERGARVRTFDPYVFEYSNKKTLKDALKGADAAIVATAHKEFVEAPVSLFAELGAGIVIDGRNCLNKDAFRAMGIIYRGIGR
jgi:nucleotide sugar dehydrogenase